MAAKAAVKKRIALRSLMVSSFERRVLRILSRDLLLRGVLSFVKRRPKTQCTKTDKRRNSHGHGIPNRVRAAQGARSEFALLFRKGAVAILGGTMRTKPARRSFKPHALAIAVSAAFLPHALAQIPPAPDTLPTYGHVAHGAARISQTPGNMQIQQSSDKAVLNWQSFSIGSNAAVNFQQPASSSVALNRVLGNDPSQIYGSLTATGRVFLVNPTGIYFAPGANVSVGSLVASTLSITDDDFLAGRYLFSNPGGAESVVNDGNIFSHSGYTALLGPQVANNGFIFANMGSVALAAGDRVSLDMVGDNLIRVNVEQSALDAAVVNTGGIDAFGGNVLLRAHSANALLDTVLNTTGIVRATGLSLQGGEIVLDGGSRGSAAIAGEVTSSGSLTVASGGHVTVAGPVSAGASMSIEVSGGNLDVFAPLSAGGDQSVRVTGGDHILVQGGSGFAGLLAGGSQAVSITGSGRNEIILGSAGALGTSVLNATLQQEIIAGAAGQQGSITLTGPDSFSGFVGITTNSGVGGQTQTVSTSGALRIQSGEALAKSSSTPTGIFHNRQGTQTINAGSIEIRAGGSGSGNSAFANSNGGGDQDVNVTGAIELVGNAGGNAGMNVNTGPFSPRHGDQEIHAGSIFMTNSPGGGFNSTATILGFHQEITTGGDVTMLSGASGGNLAGVRIGGRAETDLDMHIGGTLLMSGGTAPNNGVGIGSSSAGVALPNNIRIEAGGDVILN